MLDLKEVFDKYEEEFLKFERIENPRHPVPDLCCFLMLDELAAPYGSGERCDIVEGAEHDEIFWATDAKKIAEVATEEQVRDMIRCGLRYSTEFDSFAMFV
jgi:hypothetical protein